MKILFVVESPGKISKISSYLGDDYVVVASYGHFRDLPEKKLGVNIDDNFAPNYVITKRKIASNLKSSMAKCDMLYIAADLDMEGEAIAQHIKDLLKPRKYKRLVFNAITKKDILHAIDNAGVIDDNLVAAQKARRIIDRLYGYLISPLLQQCVGPRLSAGRVQSIALKIIVQKEEEIRQFIENSSSTFDYRFTGIFQHQIGTINTVMYRKDEDKSDHVALIKKRKKVKSILGNCKESSYQITSNKTKLGTKNPPPPFDTCSLQQEASNVYRFSVSKTMTTAQRLYEAGYITYMRTDSVHISKEGHRLIKKSIKKHYSLEHYQKKVYQNKSANAQEAHEAIRPTKPILDVLPEDITDVSQRKLYELIWKRAIASQMKPAETQTIKIQISISEEPHYYFMGKLESLLYPGYLMVYGKEAQPEISVDNDDVNMVSITAKQEPDKVPGRYTEASFVKKLKQLGIGRPSTYAQTVNLLKTREYVTITDIPGIETNIIEYTLADDEIEKKSVVINVGQEKSKICPTELGISVNMFLEDKFSDMMDINFTALMENDLDAIANGDKKWYRVVRKFYRILETNITAVKKEIANDKDRLLGKDEDGYDIYATTGRYGPVVKKIIGDETRYAKIAAPLDHNSITLDIAMDLLSDPKLLCRYQSNDVLLCRGKYGEYIKCGDRNYRIPDKMIVNKDNVMDIISGSDKEFKVTVKGTKVTGKICVGKYGPYIRANNTNYRIPKSMDHNKLSSKDIVKIIK